MYLVTTDVLDPLEAIRLVRKDDDGAVVTFLGVVRNHANGQRIQYLEYDAYKEMAEKKLREIGDEVKARWGIDDLVIWHRIGRLEIGETSLVVAIASHHRKEAFEACHWAVDSIKSRVPIWKKEVGEDGESWVEGSMVAV